MVPDDLIKSSLEKLCNSYENFLFIRNKFIRNYATFCIAGYILGIGDRHLENFLINCKNGELVGIDFGYSFGTGISLAVPELMPFRLTNNIEGILKPLGFEGILRNTLIFALSALRNHRSVLLDCSEVFVKDPLLEWLEKSNEIARTSSFKHS